MIDRFIRTRLAESIDVLGGIYTGRTVVKDGPWPVMVSDTLPCCPLVLFGDSTQGIAALNGRRGKKFHMSVHPSVLPYEALFEILLGLLTESSAPL